LVGRPVLENEMLVLMCDARTFNQNQ